MKIDLWPSNNINNFKILKTGDKIEEFFNDYFKPFKVSYVSKARVAIKLLLEYEQIGRDKNIFIQPYSSHCVFDSVGRYACPNTIDTYKSDYDIVYHQWGHKEVINNKLRSNILIEDSVDSLFIDISKKSLFPNNGKYVVISLAKIMSVPFGGLVIFKDNTDKKKFDELLDTYPKITSEYIDLKYKYQNLQTTIDYNFPTSSFEVENIEDLLNSSKERIYDNFKVLANVLKIDDLFDLSERLPSNLFFKKDINIYNKVNINGDILYKNRNYYNYNKQKSIGIDLLPIHNDVILEEI